MEFQREVSMEVSKQRKWQNKFRKGWFERMVFEMLGDHTCGGWGDVPLSWASMDVKSRDCEYVIAFKNDAFEIGLGYPDRWRIFMPRNVFLRFSLWYLWKWGWSEWFGIRRKLWYWLLAGHIRQHYPWWNQEDK